MRSLSDSPDSALPAARPLPLILAAVAPAVWGVAGLAFLSLLVRGALVLTLSGPMSLVLALLLLACRCWNDGRWSWLCRPAWLQDRWSWLFRCWLRWPWLCWGWLH